MVYYKDTKETKFHIDIKSESLRDILRTILGDVQGISLKEPVPFVEQNLLHHYLPELGLYRGLKLYRDVDQSKIAEHESHLESLIDYIKTAYDSRDRFHGAKWIDTLEVFPLHCHSNERDAREQLLNCGHRFLGLTGINHVEYLGKKAFYMEKGRPIEVTINAHFKETNPNYKKPSISEPSRSATDIWLFLDVEGTTEISTDVIKSIGKESADMAGDDVLLCNPTVLGFSLDKKLWHKHHDSRPTRCGEDFERLRSYLSIFKSHSIRAESVEARLPGIFQRASRWNALLLLDEADVYLEQHLPSEIIHNAIICVFLQTLEYYQGIMFQTTNRVSHIDDAITSRIQFKINYNTLSPDQRRSIWKCVLRRAFAGQGLPDYNSLDLENLVQRELNSQDIKNLVSIALALAEQDGTQPGESHLDIAIDTSANFESDFRAGGRIENMNNYM
ncbi:hypothetical protein BDDG_11532 [Blastomyces dermatitidis ATCC 18188]|uniref:ATPase AAA-type core domain-containing protein n=1 Tax=Ajellomyces dermatitidis (strain ATCC 18188 / CBS 674.68) TaxID=653446 RepID=A0A0J9EMD8_AJEDA|nr:hypothetical protein BDDG_11532 [Blastomyces dermatitidis ATCC 18188]